jgi:EAL domain-containing protein (putative c-di-GMP-specific phosphodiesterase class I)
MVIPEQARALRNELETKAAHKPTLNGWHAKHADAPHGKVPQMTRLASPRAHHAAEATLHCLDPRTAPPRRPDGAVRVQFAVGQALAQGRIGFHFQPVVRADQPSFVAFHEMLVRMRLPSGEVVPAGAFMPVVERTSLGRDIDRLALSQALSLLEAQPGLRVSVNMSPLTMGDEGWLALFEEAAASRRGALARLILEVTETEAIRDVDQTRDFMDHVRAAGVAFALDDFGAGATGFRHFRDLRFDMVKIDGAFVDGVATAPDAQVLVECLMAVARHFEMLTVAERVERPADAEWLARLGIDCLQGYLYARPMADIPAADDPFGALAAAG